MATLTAPVHPPRPAGEASTGPTRPGGQGVPFDDLPRILVAEFDTAGIVGVASLRFAEDGSRAERHRDPPVATPAPG